MAPKNKTQSGGSAVDSVVAQVVSNTPSSLPNPAQIQSSVTDVANTAELLRTEADRINFIPRLLGFGRRILAPADEIHVVVGSGVHSTKISKNSTIYGKSGDNSSYYWLNPLTQVIKLKTVSFTVQMRGMDGIGVEALDSRKVSFRIWAHAVAKLNPEKAEIAAQRVGLDTTSLLNTITKVGTAELVAAAATMELEEIISNRQELAEIAFPKVNGILGELGYDLALLTITKMGGDAYQKLVEQAESRVSKETSIATNKEQIAEIQDSQARERVEAEIRAETEKKLAAERLEAEREVEIATLGQQEDLDIHRHDVTMKQVDRSKSAAHVRNEADLVEAEMRQKVARTEAENAAQLRQLQAEREAELRVAEQRRTASLQLAEADAEAERLAVVQAREIERHAEVTRAEAQRLEEEELAAAQRAKEIALLEATQLAESMKVEAEGQARSLQVQVDAETKADLVKAEAEATATEKRAQAAKIRAEATRAESAAEGLANAEVETARVKIAEQQVAVTRAEGLAEAEIVEAQATAEASRLRQIKEVEISAQREQVQLYDEAPILVDIEKLKMQMSHEERITEMRMNTYLKAFEALAPNLNINIYGNGGQVSKIIADTMVMAQNMNALGDEVPAIGGLLNSLSGGSTINGTTVNRATITGEDGPVVDGDLTLFNKLSLGKFLPYIQGIVAEMNPRMLGSLTVASLVEHLTNAVSGNEDLSGTLENLKQDGNFRVVSDLPVMPLLKSVGMLPTLVEDIDGAHEVVKLTDGNGGVVPTDDGNEEDSAEEGGKAEEVVVG